MQLGRFKANQIYNEDCYKAIKDLPDKSIDLIIIDPPYEINELKGGGCILKEKRIANLMRELEDKNLNVGIKDEILKECLRVLKKPNIYIWCNKALMPKLIDFFILKRGFSYDIICWHKTNAMPLYGGKYLTDTEYCLYFRSGVKLNTTYETATTHYELPININDKNKFLHPTIKPLEMIENFIINSSSPGEVILDCFLGSGTTAVACKNTNRNYIGIEINKKWFEVACNRLNNIDASGQFSMFTK